MPWRSLLKLDDIQSRYQTLGHTSSTHGTGRLKLIGIIGHLGTCSQPPEKTVFAAFQSLNLNVGDLLVELPLDGGHSCGTSAVEAIHSTLLLWFRQLSLLTITWWLVSSEYIHG
jgi:hypothetical protein